MDSLQSLEVNQQVVLRIIGLTKHNMNDTGLVGPVL